jgi:hypothetical protein
MQKLNKYAIYIALLALIVTLIQASFHIANTFQFSIIEPNTFISACISIVSLLIVFAVGWQIWQTIDIKDKIDKINNIEQSALKMQDDISAFKIYMDAENLMLRASVNSHNNKKEESFDYIFDALYKYAEISYKDYAQAKTIKVIADTIEFITEIPHIKQEYINRCGKLAGRFQNIILKNAIVELQNCLQKKKDGKITDSETKKISQQYFDIYRQLDLKPRS